MTDRERWTVYPLLFLALGISLKDKLTQTVATKNVLCEAMVCETLQVNDLQTKSRVSINGNGVTGKNLICRSLIVADEDGKQAVAVTSNENGGLVESLNYQSGVNTVLGNFGQVSGLIFVDGHGTAHRGPMFAAPIPVNSPADQNSAKAKAPEATSPHAAGTTTEADSTPAESAKKSEQ